MSPPESAALAGNEAADRIRPRWAVARRCAMAAYAAAFVAYTLTYGLPIQRELVVLWVLGALACASLGRPWREIAQMVLDWLPLVAILALYDLTRGAADSLGMSVHAGAMIRFDKLVFLGETPPEWLQAHLYSADAVRPWDVAFSAVYTSYFIVPFAVAGVLWARNREAFLRFTKRMITLAAAGLATYIAFPAMPPWMASELGLLHGVDRTSNHGWDLISVKFASLIDHGQAYSNDIAAVPSLHAAFTALVAMFLWRRVRPAWRPLLALYPLAMGVALMATGEHYFFDVALGWAYAGLVMLGWSRWEARRLRSRPATT
jgi:hypothetical protein